VTLEACRSNFHSRPERVTCSFAMRHYHEPAGPSETNDPAGWDRASYTPDLLAELGEPIAEPRNDYREAALHFVRIMFCIDEFTTAAADARFAVIVVGIVLGWPSVRGLSIGNISAQIGCSPATITRACARFREMAGLGVSAAGGVRFVRPGAGSNGDKPAAVRA
jgi:hypothetical protein